MLSKNHRFVLEVRNEELLTAELHSLLRDNNVAFATVDHPFLHKLSIYVETADFVYIRWEGDRRKVKGTLGQKEVDRTKDIKKWAKNINEFLETSKEVFGYFSKYYSGYPPDDAKLLNSLLPQPI